MEEIDGICYIYVSSPQLDQREWFFINRCALIYMNCEAAFIWAFLKVNHYSYQDLVRIFLNTAKISFLSRLLVRLSRLEVSSLFWNNNRTGWNYQVAGIQLRSLKKKGHPAKQIFLAIWIEVNDELGSGGWSIQQADLLAVDGRIAVITFHSVGRPPDQVAFQLRRQQWMFPRACPSSQMNCSLLPAGQLQTNLPRRIRKQ